MDADDIAFPERLRIQYEYLEKNLEILAIGSVSEDVKGNLKNDIPLSYNDILLFLLSDNGFVHSSLFVRREILLAIGKYNENFRFSSDYDLICKLALTGKIENLNITLIKYRHHKNQISHIYKQEQQTNAYYIRRQYQLSFIEKYKSKNQIPISISELGYSDMGKVICLFTYYSYTNNHLYYSLAENINKL